MKKLSPGFRCPRCMEQGWPSDYGSEPKCAFSSGTFDTDNWGCRTALALRDLVPDRDAAYHNDQYSAVLPIGDCAAFLVLGWYKRRGRQEFLGVLDETRMFPLTLEIAEEILRDQFSTKIDALIPEVRHG